MRVLHFFEHVAELNDSLVVKIWVVCHVLICPDESRDVTMDLLFSGSSFAVEDIVGVFTSVSPDDGWKREAREQSGNNKTYY